MRFPYIRSSRPNAPRRAPDRRQTDVWARLSGVSGLSGPAEPRRFPLSIGREIQVWLVVVVYEDIHVEGAIGRSPVERNFPRLAPFVLPRAEDLVRPQDARRLVQRGVVAGHIECAIVFDYVRRDRQAAETGR